MNTPEDQGKPEPAAPQPPPKPESPAPDKPKPPPPAKPPVAPPPPPKPLSLKPTMAPGAPAAKTPPAPPKEPAKAPAPSRPPVPPAAAKKAPPPAAPKAPARPGKEPPKAPAAKPSAKDAPEPPKTDAADKEKKELENAAAKEPKPKEMKEREAERLTPELEKEIRELLRRMGQIINNTILYGPEHKLSKSTIDECYAFLKPLLEKCPRVNLSITDGQLLAEGKAMGLKNPFINILAGKLAELEIAGFSLMKGMPQTEFTKLMNIIVTAKPSAGEGDGFADIVEGQDMAFVHAERVKYQRVTEGEVVVEEEDLEGKKPPEEVQALVSRVQQIMAFLKGDVTKASENVAGDLAEMSTDAEQLAGLIMEAAAIRQKSSGVETGESLADIVVGCLRRTFDGLINDPSNKSKTAKKSLKKTMLLLEKNVLDKLHAIVEGVDANVDEAVSEAIEDMTSELEIDALATEYMKKRHALEKTEDRVMKYIQKKRLQGMEEDVLEEKLLEEGLPLSGWRELVVRSNVEAPSKSGPAMEGDSEVAGVSALAILLAELDHMMSASPLEVEELNKRASIIGKVAEDLAVETEEKIEELGKKIQKDREMLVGEEEADRSALKMSRDALMELLAEIVQELAQSLSAINCAIGMTLAGHIGDLNDEQREVLGVGAKCGHRLDQLLDKLIEIVGLPKGLSPDKEMVYSR